ncbi:MAG: flagellar FliJ family protein [Gemmatimonadetes bacterium]|nr:flagellar FliJ family protein [Gemmatimonadota bacterium]
MTAPRFRFSLQRILALRARAEHEAALALSAAMQAEEAARRARTEAEARRAAGHDAVRPSTRGDCTVGEMRALGALVQGLEGQAAAAGEAAEQAAQRLSGERRGFADAVRERQSMERLRSHKEELWRLEASREDRAIMDEIARARRANDAATADARRSNP